jgi:hypothetical protein
LIKTGNDFIEANEEKEDYLDLKNQKIDLCLNERKQKVDIF